MDGYAGLADLHDFYQLQPASAATPTPMPCVSLVIWKSLQPHWKTQTNLNKDDAYSAPCICALLPSDIKN